MKLSDLIYENEYISCTAQLDLPVKKITLDPEKTDSSTLFVALKGLKANFRFKKMPLAILTDESCIPKELPYVSVKNLRKQMALIYSRFNCIDYSRFKVIGITGTNGKTSTATFIKKILEGNGYKVGSIGTGHITCGDVELGKFGYSMTTPDPWDLYPALKRMENDGCNAVIMEVSSHALTLDKTAPICFDYGVFTNLSAEHLDFHKDIEDYFSEKKKLFKNVKTSIINIDDYYGRQLYRELTQRKISAGILWRGDCYVTDISNRGFDGLNYIYHGTNFTFRLNLNCAGTFNIYNTMMAISVCTDMGIAPCKAKSALNDAVNIDGRYEIIKRDITVIIDYAHTEAAFSNILADIYSSKNGHKSLTVVFGCGGERDTAKRPKIARITEKYADKIIVTTDNSRGEDPSVIIKDICAGFEKSNHKVITDRKAAIEEAIAQAKENDIVAIIGKGAEKYNIDKTGLHHFDEKEIILTALKKRQNQI